MEQRQDITKTKRLAELYMKQNTFVFIKERYPNGKSSFYNGEIVAISDLFLIFKDVKIIGEFPVPYDGIETIAPSAKNTLFREKAALPKVQNLKKELYGWGAQPQPDALRRKQ